MARPREFDVDEAIDQALQVFWQHGYRDTSMRDLLGAMGIGQSSFYDSFESKHSLYLRALDRFAERARSGPIQMIDGKGPVPDGIRVFFATWVAGLSGGTGTGCFFGNASVENAGECPEISARCRTGFDFIAGEFERALRRGLEAGEVPNSCEPRSVARFLTTTFYGLQVLAKSGMERAALQEAADVALQVLDS